ncbi:beta-1,4-galactosyltransferase [Pectobacterium carotovorum subsp. carotovorum]|uniref:glycosyltransferase family 25 protein n=1 Tax=Pectobacterium actinidiae TaxID=1507808 RepID=UPI0011987E9F|nr:glycosyltransferase family 25 protein [Pectobacterium carotovorum subsp. carotovorum]GKW17951.1 beta-1,4-galactosyltransferase [Pectobacterium carotovorum subsp. carotovorum]
MKTFVVNLEKDKNKKDQIQNECRKAKLDYEIISAIDGRELNDSELSSKVNPVSINYLSKGEIGCALSHQKIYKKILDDNIDYALILEDDVEISQDINQFLRDFLSVKDKSKGDIFLLYPSGLKFLNRKINISHDCFFYEVYNSSCAHGYIISNKAAKKLIRINTPIILVADAWLWFYQISLLKVYALNKELVKAYDFDKRFSSIETERSLLLDRKEKHQMSVIKKQSFYYVIKYYHKYIRRVFLNKEKA